MRRTTEPRELRRRAENGAGKEAAVPPAAPERFPLFRLLDEDGGGTPAESPLSDAELLSLYRWMVLSRQMDERMVAMQRQGRIGFYIGAIGEEATVLGAAAGMQAGDWIFPCYREHAAALYRGMPLAAFCCHMLGNAGDAMLGHQMPCHEGWRPGRYASISSPIGTQIPQAVGAAWAARIKREEMVSLVYFGEGATSSNDFHTGLNFAGVHKVPTVFLCRNNGWAISVPRERQTASETIAHKSLAYGMAGERVDGNDLLAVVAATRRARARAAAGEGPTLLECVTYRLEGHSTSDDPKAYRPAELVEPWRKKDPVQRLRRHLGTRGLLSEADDGRMLAEVKEEILAAIKQAEAAEPRPPLDTLIQGVYAQPMWQQREQLEEVRAAIAADPRVANPRHQG